VCEQHIIDFVTTICVETFYNIWYYKMIQLFMAITIRNICTLYFSFIFPYIGQYLQMGSAYFSFVSVNANIYNHMQNIKN
jgi:hypothetical protein